MAVMDYSLVQRIIDGTGQILDTTPGSPDSGSYVTEAQLRDWIKAGILFSGYYYNGNFYSDSGHTSPLAKVEGALYVDKTNSNKALYVCLSSTYQSLTEEAQVQAIIDGLNDGTIVPLKAKQDQNGNVIDTTYETKVDANDLKNALDATNKRVENLEEKAGDYTEVDVKSVYSVPTGKAKNMVLVGVEGVSRVNNQLVQNGDFSNGTTGWVGSNATITASDGVGTFTASAQNGQIQNTTNITLNNTHFYIFMIKVKGSSANSNLKALVSGAGAGSVAFTSISVTTSWTLLSGVFKPQNNSTTAHIDIYDDRASGWDAYQLTDVALVDLNVYFGTSDLSFLGATNAEKLATIQTNYPWLLTPSDYGTSMVKTRYEGVKSVGRNLIDWSAITADAFVRSADGEVQSYGSGDVNATDYIPVVGGSSYFLGGFTSINYGNSGAVYDINKNFIVAINHYNDLQPITIPANGAYVRLSLWLANFSDAENSAYFTLNSNPHAFTPYTTDTLSLPTPIELGSAGTVAEEAYLNEDGEAWKTNPIGSVDLGSLNWTKQNSIFYSDAYSDVVAVGSYDVVNGICAGYIPVTLMTVEATPNSIAVSNTPRIYVNDTSLASVTAEQFKTAMSGKIFYYEKATPSADTPLTPLLDNLIATEGGGTLEAVKTYPIDDSFTVGYLTL